MIKRTLKNGHSNFQIKNVKGLTYEQAATVADYLYNNSDGETEHGVTVKQCPGIGCYKFTFDGRADVLEIGIGCADHVSAEIKRAL
jgi:hypothetical protein